MALATYTELVDPARRRMSASRFATLLSAPSISCDQLEAFLIQFCSLGVAMTKPVEGWIRRAGERCVAIGLDELGHALIRHASHEAGHHELMIADTESLVLRRHQRGLPLLVSG